MRLFYKYLKVSHSHFKEFTNLDSWLDKANIVKLLLFSGILQI